MLLVTEELCSEPSRPPESRHLSLPAWCWPPIVARKPWAVSIDDQRFHWLPGTFQLRGKAAVTFSTKLRLSEMLLPEHVGFTFCDACPQRMTDIFPTVLEQPGNRPLVRRCQGHLFARWQRISSFCNATSLITSYNQYYRHINATSPASTLTCLPSSMV